MQLAEDLQTALLDEQEEVRKLTIAVTQKSRGGGGGNTGKDLLLKEMEQEKEEAVKQGELVAEELSKLKDQHSELEARYRHLDEDFKEAKISEASLTESVALMKKENAEMREAQKAGKARSENLGKDRSEAMDESRKLKDANTMFSTQNIELTMENKRLLEEKLVAEHYIADLIEKNDALELGRDSFDIEKEDIISERENLKFQLQEANEKLYAALDDSEHKEQVEGLTNQIKAMTAQYKASSDADAKNIAALKAKLEKISNDTEAGRKQRELDKSHSDLQKMAEMLESMRIMHLEDEAAKKLMAQTIRDFENDMKNKVAAKVVQSKEKLLAMERNYESLKKSTSESANTMKAIEQERDELSHERDELLYWKDKYDKQKGYEALSRQINVSNQQIKSLNRQLEDRMNKLSKMEDSNGRLRQAFERLKRETNKDAKFTYNEYELDEEIQCETARLEAEVRLLEDQRSDLELENTRLRKQVTKMAGSLAKDGMQFAGLNANQVLSITEYAENLRNGKDEKPVDEHSLELQRVNRRLTERVQEMQHTLDGLEKDGFTPSGAPAMAQSQQGNNTPGGGGGQSAGLSRVQEAEISHMNENMRKLLLDNSEMRSRMMAMQDEVIATIRNQGDHALGHTDLINNIIRDNNAGLLNELQSLKSMQGSASGTLQPNALQQMQVIQQQLEHQQKQAAALGVTGAKDGAKDGSATAHKTPSHKHKAKFTKHASLPVGSTPAPISHGASATPMMGVGEFGGQSPYAQTPFGMTGQMPYAAPYTPAGQTLLAKNLQQMNLPNEEWVEEVKQLNGQLVEALEQLHERELELDEQNEVTSVLEENLVHIKQQMASLYHDFAHRSDNWERIEKDAKNLEKTLTDERNDLKLKLQRMQDVLAHVKKEDPESLEAKLVEATRKTAVYEINEAVLSRKYVSQSEMLEAEREKCNKYEQEFVEMESGLKQRILYLEQYKQSAGSRIAFLQGKLDTSVPIQDFSAIQKELDALREEHLSVLRREVDARVAALKGKEQGQQLRAIRLSSALMQAELQTSRATAMNLAGQLENQKEITNRAVGARGNADMSSFVSDIALFRGEVGRLEVEHTAAIRRSEALKEELAVVTREADGVTTRSEELENLLEEATLREEDLRKACLDMQLKYEGGMDREDSDAIQRKIEKVTAQYEEVLLESGKYKEMAEIASRQAQSIGEFHAAHEDEVKALREQITKLESRSDDDILIGRLQRQLMAMKSSYKAFVQKYQMLRGGMRQRELSVRLLEARLDQREEAVSNMQETHRLEVSALKKALRNVRNMTEGDPYVMNSKKKDQKSSVALNMGFVKLGEKLLRMSGKVKSLSEMAEEALAKATSAEDESNALQSQVESLTADLDIHKQRASDLQLSIEKSSKAKTQAIASRLVSLSEEVRTNKLACLQQRRQIHVLRQEKRHFQNLLSSSEADIESLEVNKVFGETKGLLDDLRDDDAPVTGKAQPYEKPGANLDISTDVPVTAQQKKTTFKSEIPPEDGIEELVTKIEGLTNDLGAARRDASNARLQADKFRSQSDELEATLSEMQSQLGYYERMAQQEGLPAMRGGAQNAPPGTNTKQYRAMQEKQSQLQEAAGATIDSLKQLLSEKNRELDRLNERVLEMQSQGGNLKRQSRADKKAEALLERLEADDRTSKLASKFQTNTTGITMDSDAHEKLLSQLERADDVMQEKDRSIMQLRADLEEQRNLAELRKVRAGEAQEEIALMKDDMLKLAQQVQISEDRLRRATGKSSLPSAVSAVGAPSTNMQADERKILELSRTIKMKDEKLKEYKDIIMRIKDEFIKSEEKAMLDAMQANSKNTSARGGDSGASSEELKALREQVAALRDGMRAAKEDVEKGRRARERLGEARSAAEEEARRFEAQIGASEASAATAQSALNKVRKDLEDSRRKEGRLRDKLKELLETEGGADKVKDIKAAQERAETMEKEVEVLRAQNLALRRAAEEMPVQVGSKRSVGNISTEGKPVDEHAGVSTAAYNSATGAQQNKASFGGTSNTLGGDGAAPQDELRAQLHTKWESEKKLQKRLTVIEKRLQEKMEECEDLTSQLKRARETTAAAITAKEQLAKSHKSSSAAHADTGKPGAKHASHAHGDHDAAAIESANAKVYALEETVASLRRKAEVEQVNEISKLRHQVSVMTVRLGELEAETEESEMRRKKQAAGGGKTLRDSEDRFLREERLKDDLDIARRQRLELEAAMLDRDARAIEARFDLESREHDTERMRKRIAELENAYRAVASQAGQSTHHSLAGAKDKGGSKGGDMARREADLEGTIEAMKRVVDKLKAENDRLRKGGTGEDRKTADIEKKIKDEKKRADTAEQEVAGLKAKLKGAEESSQKLVQRQQQLATLRKQLKQRDDEISSMKESTGGHLEEVDNLKRKLKTYEDRISTLESTASQASARGNSAGQANERMEKEVMELRKRTRAQEGDLERLRVDLMEAQRNSAAQAGAGQTYPARPGGKDDLASNAELKRLKTENEKLRQELAAFDMDFFEEIEQLKYSHAEAVKKLRAYEAAESQGRGGRGY